MRVQEHFTYHSLEARVEMCEEGRLVLLGQDSLLHHGTFHVIVLDHHVLLQDLYCVKLFSGLHLCQHDLRRDRHRGRDGWEKVISMYNLIFLAPLDLMR